MKITLVPKTDLGKLASILCIAFIIMILLKSSVGFPLPTFMISGIGAAGFVVGVIAIIKKDRSIGSFLSILVGVVIIFVFASIGISSIGLFKDFPVKESLTQAEAGGDSGKAMNLGIISQNGGWIYYVSEDNLYKIKTDWTEKTKISQGKFNSIYVSDGWVYYTNSEDGNLYKIKTDGTGQMKISDDNIESFFVQGDWTYYRAKGINASEKDISPKGVLYRVKIDGSEKIRIAEITLDSSAPKILGDWIYYSDSENLFKIRTDGTEQTLVAKDAGIEYVSGDWIYYIIRADEGKGLGKITVCRIKPDGTEKSVSAALSGVYVSTFDNDWLYYTSGKGLSRMKFDGTGNEKLNDVNIWGLMGVSGNWMYINDYAGPMFRVKLDGSVGTRIK